MYNKGCNNCINYKIGEIKMWDDNVPHKCLLGNDNDFNSWWEENGIKKSSDCLTDIHCFEESNLSKSKRELNDALQKLIDYLNNK